MEPRIHVITLAVDDLDDRIARAVVEVAAEREGRAHGTCHAPLYRCRSCLRYGHVFGQGAAARSGI